MLPAVSHMRFCAMWIIEYVLSLRATDYLQAFVNPHQKSQSYVNETKRTGNNWASDVLCFLLLIIY